MAAQYNILQHVDTFEHIVCKKKYFNGVEIINMCCLKLAKKKCTLSVQPTM